MASEKDVHDFLHSLALIEAPPSLKKSRLPKDETDGPGDTPGAAKVVGSTMVAFTENVSSQHKQDITNALNIAQLAANKKVDKEKDTERYYKEYANILSNIGFVMNRFTFQKYSSSGVGLTMDKAVLGILTALVAGPGAGVATAAITALGKLGKDDDAMKIFSHSSSNSDGGTFEVAVVDEDSSGTASFTLGTFRIKTDQSKGSFLWISWSSDSMEMYFGSQTVLFNESVYARVRTKVADKLGDKAEDFVEDLF